MLGLIAKEILGENTASGNLAERVTAPLIDLKH
jgi:hypothetical protein